MPKSEVHSRRARVRLAGDVEPGPAVRVSQGRDERVTSVQGDTGDAQAGVAHPLRLEKLRRGTNEHSLSFNLVELVCERPGFSDRGPVVIAMR